MGAWEDKFSGGKHFLFRGGRKGDPDTKISLGTTEDSIFNSYGLGLGFGLGLGPGLGPDLGVGIGFGSGFGFLFWLTQLKRFSG